MTSQVTIAVVVLAIVLLSFACLAMYYQLRLRGHRGWPRQDFIEHFSAAGVSPSISAAVYDYYAGLAVWRSFGVSPEDNLERVFGHSPEELLDDLEPILRKLKLRTPNNPTKSDWPYTTVTDMVRLVDWISRNQNPYGPKTQSDPFC